MSARAHYDRLIELLDLERRAEVEQLRADRGDVVTRLTCVGEEGGLAERFLLTFARANGEELPPGTVPVGSVVALRLEGEDAAPTGVVARRSAARVVVAFDDEPPEWVEGASRLALERLPDDATWKRQRGAVERVRSARAGRLAELRDTFDGVREEGRPRARSEPPLDEDLLAGLDESQRAAVRFALDAPNLALIHGPPGTGKTTVLVALARAAVARGERVLACAPSNAAVDLLAERLAAAGVRTVRIGHPARISEAILAASLDERVRAHDDATLARRLVREADEIRRKLRKAGRGAPSREDRRALRDELRALLGDAHRIAQGAAEKVLEGAEVVCATLTGTAEGPPLGERRFDLVILDEAAQALEPASWIAIARAGRVVLAGDHHQLPPTILSLEAARGGLARTLFERLHERSGERRARMLSVQYRMHEAIAAFSNERFYGGALRAAPANARHVLADLPGVRRVEPWTTAPLLLFDTSGAGFEETRPGGETSVANEGEARVVARVVREWTAAGVAPARIGVIAPYAAQVLAIREQLPDEVARGLEVDSADGFQGREREAIVVSFTRCNDAGEIGFLADYRRANVALTRARRALVAIGDGATLGADDFYAAFFARCEAAGALRSAWEILE